LGGSAANLAVRLRLLWQHGYLERPWALRPTRVLTEEIAYGLGKAGARLLERHHPKLRIGHLDWNETPGRQRGLPYIDHQLGIATFMVALKAACDTKGVLLHWDGHHLDRPKLKIAGGAGAICPDAHFALEVPGAGIAHHFLEVDRGNVSLARMAERYQEYLAFWQAAPDSSQFRVITVTEDPAYLQALRKVAAESCRMGGQTWKALLFTSASAVSLTEPQRILGAAFWYAAGDTPVSLLAGAERVLK
jgi:Replication-relaxation